MTGWPRIRAATWAVAAIGAALVVLVPESMATPGAVTGTGEGWVCAKYAATSRGTSTRTN